MFNKTIPRGGDGAGMGWGGCKKCKPIPAPSRGAGLKSYPIPAPPPLWGGENLHGAKRGGAGQNCHPQFSCLDSSIFKPLRKKFILKLELVSLLHVTQRNIQKLLGWSQKFLFGESSRDINILVKTTLHTHFFI